MSESRSLTIQVERNDDMPAFGAFLRPKGPDEGPYTIRLNVCSLMLPELPDEDDEMVPMTREDRKRALISTLMHEFGHALEHHLGVPVNEAAIEAACEEWEELYYARTEDL